MNAFLFMIDNLISKQHPLRYCWQVARWAGYGVWGTMKLTMKWRRGSLYIFSVTNSRANVCPKMLVWGCSSCTWHGKNKSFSHNFGKFWNEWKNTMMVLMICDLGTNVCDLRAGEAMVDTWRIARLLVGKKIPNRVLQTKFCVRTFTNPSSFLSFSSLIWILCHHRIQWKHHQMKWNVLSCWTFVAEKESCAHRKELRVKVSVPGARPFRLCCVRANSWKRRSATSQALEQRQKLLRRLNFCFTGSIGVVSLREWNQNCHQSLAFCTLSQCCIQLLGVSYMDQVENQELWRTKVVTAQRCGQLEVCTPWMHLENESSVISRFQVIHVLCLMGVMLYGLHVASL